MMTVQIGQYGSINIGHKTQSGNLRHVLEIGNHYREEKGLAPKDLRDFFRLESTWEYVIKLQNDIYASGCFKAEKEFGYSPKKSVLFSTIKDLPKDFQGRIDESAIFKTHYFDDVVRKQNRGKLVNRGIWGHLYLMLDLAIWLDVDLKHEVYKTFVEGQILQLRDDGGESFKVLNVAIDNYLPTSGGVGNNKLLYCKAAEKIRKVVGLDKKVLWNNATAGQLAHRDKLLTNSVMFLERGFLKTEQDLLNNLK